MGYLSRKPTPEPHQNHARTHQNHRDGRTRPRNLIRPIATQGHIGDVLLDKIVYDAQTTSGGSGGPLFNNEGKVIGINFAMVREFGGSNFAIPVGYGKSLLNPKPAPLQIP